MILLNKRKLKKMVRNVIRYKTIAKYRVQMAFLKCQDLVAEINDYVSVPGMDIVGHPKRHFLEKIIWILVFLISIFGIEYVCMYQWKRYVANPTVISIDRDYRNWNVTLPAITVCYLDNINKEKADEYIFTKWHVNSSHTDYEYYFSFIETVTNSMVGDFYDFMDFEHDERLEYIDLRQLSLAVHPGINHDVTSFDPNAQVLQEAVFTEFGLCYLINAPIAKILNNPPENVTVLGKPLTCNSQKNQCFLKVNVEKYTAMVILHAPFEVPVYDKPNFILKHADESVGTYKIVETVVADAVQELNVEQRNCILYKEMIGKNYIFSGSLCSIQCRIDTAIQFCQCKPYFYPYFDGPDCTISGLICLHKYSWPYVLSFKRCECPYSCAQVDYLESNFVKRSWSIDDDSFITKSAFRIEMIPPKMRLNRQVIFSLEDFLVSFGGAATLFLGCSVWQIIKLVYIIIIKVFT